MKASFIKLYFNDLLKILYLSFTGFRKSKIGYRDIIRVILTQLYFTSIQALIVILILAFFIAMLISYYYVNEFSVFDFSLSQNNILFLIILQQIIPMLTAFLIIARSCTAIATELGNMKVNKEILALESLGVSQIQYIIAPRIIAGIISVLSLAIVFCMSFVFFFIFITSLGMDNFDYSNFLASLHEELSGLDIILFVLKNIVIGAFIFIISSINGLSVTVYYTEVPVATINAVVHSIMFCVIASLFFSLLSILINGVI